MSLPRLGFVKSIYLIFALVLFQAEAYANTISGSVISSNGSNIKGASISYSGTGQVFSTISGNDGSFDLDINTAGLPNKIVVTIVKDGYIPLAIPMDTPGVGGVPLGVLVLETQKSSVSVLEPNPIVRRIGDGTTDNGEDIVFQGSLTATSYSANFNVNSDQLTGNRATVSFLARGSQSTNRFFLNGSLIGNIDASPADGSFSLTKIADIPISNFTLGTNSLTFESNVVGFNSDDFELINIIVSFTGTESILNTPAEPAFISASDNTFSNYVRLTWPAVSGATSYTVYRCTNTQIASCSSISGVPTTSYNHGGGSRGVVYYYRVDACNQWGCSDVTGYNIGSKSLVDIPESDNYNSIYGIEIQPSSFSFATNSTNSTVIPGVLSAGDPIVGEGLYIDVHEITLEYDSLVNFNLSMPGRTSFMYLAERDSNQQLLTQEAFTSNNGLLIVEKNLTAGTYWIGVTTNEAGVSVTYDLTIANEITSTLLSYPTIDTVYGWKVQVTPSPLILGTLNETSSIFYDGTYLNVSEFTVTSKANFQINMSSSEFDTYLFLVGIFPDGTIDNSRIYNNDDSDGSTNSQLILTLEPGRYWLGANSYAKGVTGDYRITIKILE